MSDGTSNSCDPPGSPSVGRGLRVDRGLTALEAGGDHGHAHMLAHRVVDHGAEDDVGVLVGRALDDLGGLVDLEQAEVVGTGDVEQHAARALDARLEQR